MVKISFQSGVKVPPVPFQTLGKAAYQVVYANGTESTWTGPYKTEHHAFQAAKRHLKGRTDIALIKTGVY